MTRCHVNCKSAWEEYEKCEKRVEDKAAICYTYTPTTSVEDKAAIC